MPNKSLDLIHTVGQWPQNWWFCERSKGHSTDFTRDRKVGFVGVMSMILNLVRRSTQGNWMTFGIACCPSKPTSRRILRAGQTLRFAGHRYNPRECLWTSVVLCVNLG